MSQFLTPDYLNYLAQYLAGSLILATKMFCLLVFKFLNLIVKDQCKENSGYCVLQRMCAKVEDQ